MNAEAIKKEINRLTADLAATTDRYDAHFITMRLDSLRAELSGVVAQPDTDYGCND